MTNDEAIFLFAGELGIRPYDIMRLRWENIDMSRREIRFRVAKNGTDTCLPMTPAVSGWFATQRRSPGERLFSAHPRPGTAKECHTLRVRFLRRYCLP